jgi:hypothetical protein
VDRRDSFQLSTQLATGSRQSVVPWLDKSYSIHQLLTLNAINGHEIATAFLEIVAKNGGGVDSADEEENNDVGAIENENDDDDDDKMESWDGYLDLQVM